MTDVIAEQAGHNAPAPTNQADDSPDAVLPPGWYDARVRELLEVRHIKEPQPIRLAYADALLGAAYSECIEGKRYLWIGLIATAMAPRQELRIHPSFIDTLRALNATDTTVLTEGMGLVTNLTRTTTNAAIAARTKLPISEISAAVEKLVSLECLIVVKASRRVHIAPYGRALMVACIGLR